MTIKRKILLREVLERFNQTCRYILDPNEYPNASPLYKRSSFIVGAQDMAMSFVSNATFEDRIEFAKQIDAIRTKALVDMQAEIDRRGKADDDSLPEG